jgi:hypothetical protein
MVKPPVSMNPTGQLRIAWTGEVATGAVQDVNIGSGERSRTAEDR